MLLYVTFIERTFSSSSSGFYTDSRPALQCLTLCWYSFFTSSGPWHPLSGYPLHGVLFTELRLCPFMQIFPPLILPLPALYRRTPSSPEVRLCFYGDTLFILLVLQCPAPNYLPTQTLSSPLGQATNSAMWTPSYTYLIQLLTCTSSVAFPFPPPSSTHSTLWSYLVLFWCLKMFCLPFKIYLDPQEPKGSQWKINIIK